jgi:hypothetical protein
VLIRSGHSSGALNFDWAQFEVLIDLNEGTSGEAGKHVRLAL